MFDRNWIGCRKGILQGIIKCLLLTLPTLPLGTTAIFWLRFEFLIDIHFDFSGCALTWLMSAFGGKADISKVRQQCPLMTQSGHRASLNRPQINSYDTPFQSLGARQCGRDNECLLLGVKRTFIGRAAMSAFDPKRTWGVSPMRCDAGNSYQSI